jgi:hypothetical protein
MMIVKAAPTSRPIPSVDTAFIRDPISISNRADYHRENLP